MSGRQIQNRPAVSGRGAANQQNHMPGLADPTIDVFTQQDQNRVTAPSNHNNNYNNVPVANARMKPSAIVAPQQTINNNNQNHAAVPQMRKRIIIKPLNAEQAMAAIAKVNKDNAWTVPVLAATQDIDGGSALHNSLGGDGSSNHDHFKHFAKAATFVENSTKVWAHRVDSTHTLSLQMLNRLRRNDTGGGGDEDGGGDDDKADNGGGGKHKKKKRKELQRTIAINASEINMENANYNNAGDKGQRVTYGAMFAAMTQKFDQGFKGLLLNNAPIGSGGNPYLDRDFAKDPSFASYPTKVIASSSPSPSHFDGAASGPQIYVRAVQQQQQQQQTHPDGGAVHDASRVGDVDLRPMADRGNNRSGISSTRNSTNTNTVNFAASAAGRPPLAPLTSNNNNNLNKQHENFVSLEDDNPDNMLAGFDHDDAHVGGYHNDDDGGEFDEPAAQRHSTLSTAARAGGTGIGGAALSRAASVAATLSRAASVAGDALLRLANDQTKTEISNMAQQLHGGFYDDDGDNGDLGDDGCGSGGGFDADGFALPVGAPSQQMQQHDSIVSLASDGAWLPLASQKGSTLRFGAASGNAVLNSIRKGTKLTLLDTIKKGVDDDNGAGDDVQEGARATGKGAAAAAASTSKKPGAKGGKGKRVAFEASLKVDDLRRFDTAFSARLKQSKEGQNVLEALPDPQRLKEYTVPRFAQERSISRKLLLPRASAFEQEQLTWFMPRSAASDVTSYYQPFCAPNAPTWNLLSKYTTAAAAGGRGSGAEAGGGPSGRNTAKSAKNSGRFHEDCMQFGDDDFGDVDGLYDGDDDDLPQSHTLLDPMDLGPNFAEEDDGDSFGNQLSARGSTDAASLSAAASAAAATLAGDETAGGSGRPSSRNVDLLKLIEAPAAIDLGQFVIPASLTQVNVVRLRACMWKRLEEMASPESTRRNWQSYLEYRDTHDDVEDDDDGDDAGGGAQDSSEIEEQQTTLFLGTGRNAAGKRPEQVRVAMSNGNDKNKNNSKAGGATTRAKELRRSAVFSECVLRMLPDVPSFVRGGSLSPAFFFFSLLFISNERGLLLVPLRLLAKANFGSTHCEDILVMLASEKKGAKKDSA